MKIGLIYAMTLEIESLLTQQNAQPLQTVAGVPFYQIREGVIACAGGVGKVNAAMATQLMISLYQPDLILNAGVAGCFDVARYSTTNPSGHVSDGMMAIMAVVMGGTSMKGGIASVSGTMMAVLIPVTLQTGMIVLGINSYYQLIVTGFFLILAVYVDYVRNLKPKA